MDVDPVVVLIYAGMLDQQQEHSYRRTLIFEKGEFIAARATLGRRHIPSLHPWGRHSKAAQRVIGRWAKAHCKNTYCLGECFRVVYEIWAKRL